MRQSALSLIVDDHGRVLSVWNRRFKGWGLPGGKVEEGESPIQTQARELREETGLETVQAVEVYTMDFFSSVSNLSSLVHVFLVQASGTPYACEEGTAVSWFGRETLVRISPFGSWYGTMFEALKSK